MLLDELLQKARECLATKAEAPRGTLPALKMPDPAFLVSRLNAGKSAGLLSRMERSTRVGEPQALVNELGPLGFDRMYVFAVVEQEAPRPIYSMADLSDELLQGIDRFSSEEFSTEHDIYYVPLRLITAFSKPLELKRVIPGRRFGADVDFARDVVKTNKALLDVHGVVQSPDIGALQGASQDELKELDAAMHALFERAFPVGVASAEGLTREDVVNAHILLRGVLQARHIETVETDALAEESHSLSSTEKRDLLETHPSGEAKHAEDPILLDEVLNALDKPTLLRSPAVFVVGSTCTQGHSKNDVDILIRGPMDDATRSIIEFKLGRALDPRISQRVQFHGDEAGGPFTDHVALYDLALVPHEDRTVKQMAAQDTIEVKADDPMLDWPKGPGKVPAALQLHFRGASMHADLRMKVAADHLVGWTLAVQRKGTIGQVETIEEGKAAADVFSMDGSRYNKPLVLPDRIFAVPKSRQPLAWLSIGNEVFEPGSVGATRFEPGVFLQIGRFNAEWGTQDSYYHEYFLTGLDDFFGTLTFRQLQGQGGSLDSGLAQENELFWTGGFSNPLPSVLRRRVLTTGAMPPRGQSAMPISLMEITPKEFRFWESSSEKEAKTVRDELIRSKFFTETNVSATKEGYHRVTTKRLFDFREEEVKVDKTFRFSLSRQTFKGQQVIRFAPSREIFHLVLGYPTSTNQVWDFQLQTDPLSKVEQISALQVGVTPELMRFEGDVPPGKRIGGVILNDTKATPSTVEIIDTGEVSYLKDEVGYKVIRFAGKELKGIFTLQREEPESSLWFFSVGEVAPRGNLSKEFRTNEGGMQVWEASDKAASDDKDGDRLKLRPPAIFQPQKPPPRDTAQFTDMHLAAKTVFTDALVEQGVQVEPKWNGFRVVAEAWSAGGRKALIFTEDAQRDLAENLPHLSAEIEKLPGDIILDGEIMAVDENGDFLSRADLAQFRPNKPIDDTKVRYMVFDVLYLGKNLTATPQHERRAVLERLSSSFGPNIILTPKRIARGREEILTEMKWAAAEPGSEGAMLKQLESTISLGGENDLWAKVKMARTVRAIVIDRHEVAGSPGVFNFTCAVGPISESDRDKFSEVVELNGRAYVQIGTTGNRKIDAKPGDTLEAETLEIFWEDHQGKIRLRWFGPAKALGVVHAAPMTLPDIHSLMTSTERSRTTKGDRDAERFVRIVKSDAPEEEHFVFGVVLVPNDVDSQGDVYSVEEVRKAAYSFMEDFNAPFRVMHQGSPIEGVIVLETYLSKVEEIHKEETFPVGTWFLGVRVTSEPLWEAVKVGKFTGFSMGGTAIRESLSS
jgi:hypothetical protein